MTDVMKSSQDSGVATGTDAQILEQIKEVQARSSRKGQIREARKFGYTMIGISAAGVIGR